MALNWLENGDVDHRTRWHCAFILLQIKASAKLKILQLMREIPKVESMAGDGNKVAELQYELRHALSVHELLSPTGGLAGDEGARD
jgi:hypothetical protein